MPQRTPRPREDEPTRLNFNEQPASWVLLRRALVIAGTSVGYALVAGLAVAVRAPLNRTAARRLAYRTLNALLQRLGPTFVKAGQILSTRRDLLPAAFCEELATLQSRVRPLTERRARRALSEVYGDELKVHFCDIFYREVSGGSIACVYRARLHDGRSIALKVRRPAIATRVLTDLTLIGKATALATRLPVLRGIPVRDMIDHLCRAIGGQLDFEREAESLARLRTNLGVLPNVHVPRVLPELSSSRCIAMEYVPDLTAQPATSAGSAELAQSVLAVVYEMLFIDGFVHCDLHPGNLCLAGSGQVVLLDAGFSMWLSERVRDQFTEFFLNLGTGNGERCARIVIESSLQVNDRADLDGFVIAVSELVERNTGVAAKNFSLLSFAGQLFDAQRCFGLYAASEFVFPLLSLLVVEGTIRDLDPYVDFQLAARPVVQRALLRNPSPRAAGLPANQTFQNRSRNLPVRGN